MVVLFGVRYGFLLVCYSNFVRKVSRTIRLQNALKTELRVSRCHWKYQHSIERVGLLIDVIYSNYGYRVVSEIFNV